MRPAITLALDSVTPDSLLESVTAHGRINLDGWLLNYDDDGIWITNPYGLDVGWIQPTLQFVEGLLRMIAERNREDREWGHL